MKDLMKLSCTEYKQGSNNKRQDWHTYARIILPKILPRQIIH